jgi:hypothetical protein
MCYYYDLILDGYSLLADQTNAATTLSLVLREVEKCTVFVGILGERYGWSVSQAGMELWREKIRVFC